MRKYCQVKTLNSAKYFAFAILLNLAFSFPLLAISTPQSAVAIATELCDSLRFSRPVILDIRCGEWTPSLELEIRRILLSKKVDLRESGIDRLSFPTLDTNPDSTDLIVNSGKNLFQTMGLTQAELIEVTLEQNYEVGEKRSFLSYSRYQTPVYRFILKHENLPEQSLLEIHEYYLKGDLELENPGSILALKWYEPVVATALIGTLLIMLWTLK